VKSFKTSNNKGDNFNGGTYKIWRWPVTNSILQSSFSKHDVCRLKHYRWVNKHAMSRQMRLKHTPWHRQPSVNHCLQVDAKHAFHNFEVFLIFFHFLFLKLQVTVVCCIRHINGGTYKIWRWPVTNSILQSSFSKHTNNNSLYLI
jgi:hypothetical protein